MRALCRNPALFSALLFGLAFSGTAGVRADTGDDNAAIEDETEKKKLEKALLVAEKELLVAEAELRAAKFSSLGLPQYENKTTFGAKGGEIEAAMLASWAVREAAETVANVSAVKTGFPVTPATASTGPLCSPVQSVDNTKRGVVLVLSGNDIVDFSFPQTVALQMQVLEEAYQSAFAAASKLDAASPELAVAGVSTALLALKTAAGLFGQETTVTGVDMASIDDAMLANAVAGQLAGCSVLVTKTMGVPDFGNSAIYDRLQKLIKERIRGQELVASYPGKPSDAQKAVIALFKEADTQLAAFHKAATTATDKGVVPLSQAILLEKIDLRQSRILRVSVNAKGGSLVNSKNIATTFGVDPVKVSGGLVVSYSVTHPGDGLVKEAGIVTCQTSLASLRKIQTRRWTSIDKPSSSATTASQQLAICHI